MNDRYEKEQKIKSVLIYKENRRSKEQLIYHIAKLPRKPKPKLLLETFWIKGELNVVME